MTEQDKPAFRDMMINLSKIYNQTTPEKTEMVIWYNKLITHELRSICKVVDVWVNKSKYMPTLTDIISSLPKPVIMQNRLEAPKLSKEQNKIHADKIVSIVHSTSSHTDHRAWAKTILKNPSSYIPYAVKCATEALKGNNNGF